MTLNRKALHILKFNPKEASVRLEKLLLSALANWEAKNEGNRIEDSQLYVEKIICATVLFSVIFFLPLFLYNRWKDKNIRDYTLTKENFDRMKNIKKKKKVQ